MRAIQVLTHKGVEADELRASAAARSIEEQLGDYYIFEIDRNPVACVALHVYPDRQKGELAHLYVSSSHENLGIGRKLIQFVESRARELGLVASCSRSPRRRSPTSSPRPASPKARPTICRRRAARDTSGAAAARRC